MQKCYSLRDVAGLLGIRSHRVAYAVSSGAVPEPGQRIGNKRVFTDEDIVRLLEHFGVCLPNEPKESRHEG